MSSSSDFETPLRALSARVAMIGLDWGTSSIRAYLLSATGGVLQQREGDEGILKAAAMGFPAVFDRYVGDWRRQDPRLPVLMCGMIGSRQGWVEVPYLKCPASLADLGAALCTVEPAPGIGLLRVVPGLCVDDGPTSAPDVMRGEETQLAGAFDMPDASGLCVLPGTHSKWAHLAHGRIERFATYMTGELFALLRQHSILGRLMPDDAAHDDAAFARGLHLALASDANAQGLLHQLFSVRTLGLFQRLDPAALASYLSGLLIGSELASVRHSGYLPSPGPRQPAVVVVGNHRLGSLYRQALSLMGLRSTSAPTDAAARGLWRIARFAHDKDDPA